MASRNQIEANQKNAQNCTGPTSEAGKATSSRNALKTGIDAKSEVIRVESQAEYDELIAEFYGRYHPTVPEERMLVDALIRTEWLSRRYMCTEKSVWERGFNETDSTSLGLVFIRFERFLDRLNHRINSAQRNSQKALKQLLEVRAKNAANALPSRDCQGAVPETPNTNVATEPLNPKLDSFLTFPDPPQVQPAKPEQNGKDEPPIAA